MARLRPFFSSYANGGHGETDHLFRTLAISDSWSAGFIIPKWCPTLAGGFGYPLFTFYGWLPYALSGALYRLGLTPAEAVNAVFILSGLLLSIGSYALGRKLGGIAGGVLCWALCALAPYNLINVFVRNALPEYFATALSVLWLLSMVRVCSMSASLRRIAIAGLLGALLVIAHNVTAFMMLPLGFLVVLLYSISSKRLLSVMPQLLAVLAVILVCSAFFYVPVTYFRSSASLGKVYGSQYNYANHFLWAKQLASLHWGFGPSLAGPDDDMPFHCGYLQMLVCAAAPMLLLSVRLRKSPRVRCAALLGLAALCLLVLTLTYAQPIWHILPPLQLVQFPWRLLLPFSILSGIVAALVLPDLLAERASNTAVATATSIAGFAFIFSFVWAHPAARLPIYEPALRSEMATGAPTTTQVDEYLPPEATDVLAISRQDRRRPTLNGNVVDVQLPPPIERRNYHLALTAKQLGTLLIPTLSFPCWKVEVNGMPVTTQPAPFTGFLSFTIRPGNHDIHVSWSTPLAVRIADLISAAGWIMALITLFTPRKLTS